MPTAIPTAGTSEEVSQSGSHLLSKFGVIIASRNFSLAALCLSFSFFPNSPDCSSSGEEIPLRLDIWTGSSVTRRENTYDKEIGAHHTGGQMIAERRPEI